MADPNSLEIDPADAELAKLAKELAGGPLREDFLRILKKHNPNQPIPEIDTKDAMQKYAEPHIKKVAELQNELLRDRVERGINEKRAVLREQGYSKEDVEAIEKMMVEKKIPSYDTAAEHFKMSKQLATPTPNSLSQTGVNTLPIDKKAIKEAGGIRNWARGEAHKAADDIKFGRVKLH